MGRARAGRGRGLLEATDVIRGAAIERAESSLSIEDHRHLIGEDLQQAVSELRVFLEVNPRLLALMCALRRSWEGQEVGGVRPAVPAERGVPSWHPQIDASPDRGAKGTLEEMVEILDLPAPNTDYQAMAKWPGYLGEAWAGLRSWVATDSWREACSALDWAAEHIALALPTRISVSPARAGDFELTDEDVKEVGTWIETFHGILPGVIANTSYLWVGLRGGAMFESAGTAPRVAFEQKPVRR